MTGNGLLSGNIVSSWKIFDTEMIKNIKENSFSFADLLAMVSG